MRDYMSEWLKRKGLNRYNDAISSYLYKAMLGHIVNIHYEWHSIKMSRTLIN